MKRSLGRLSVVFGVVAAMALSSTNHVPAATARLPNLGMAKLADIKIDKGPNGQRVLRFSTTIVNVGNGRFEVRAQRADTNSAWSVGQRVYDDAGGFSDISSSATLVYGGDGHDHWHIRNLEAVDLIRMDNGSKVGTFGKYGYCFWDNVAYRLSLAGAPQTPLYTRDGCGSLPSTSIAMGLSTGWGDIYPATLPDQYIDISGLGAGRYRLQVTANALNQFVESDSDRANNTTWVDLQLQAKGGSLKIVGWGPAA
jgi:Lysyl oxidase